MRRAIAEAKKGIGFTTPNPAVGAVLVKDGKLIAAGYHAKAGGDHGEVAALRKVGFDAAGCDLYTTLEPCNHTGRTGPCTEAIIKSGVKHVFVGALDPNPLVAGGGVRRLRRAGIEVTTGILEEECTALNEPYNHAILHRRPFVVMKAAMSLDGKTATRTGDSKWITSEEARAEGRKLRRDLDAILVGVDTVIADDPQLTAREEGGRDPVRVVLDSTLRIPKTAQLVRTAKDVRTIVCTTRAAPADRVAALERKGVEVLVLKKTRSGQVDPARVLDALFELELNGVLVEGGARIHGAFVDAGLVDKVVLFVAPVLIGGDDAPPAVGGKGAAQLEKALRLERVRTEPIGPDLMIVGYRPA